MAIRTDFKPSTPKNLLPGTQVARILSVSLESPAYDKEAYHVVLNMEGPDMGPEFEGFAINREDPDSPKHIGQVGRVKSGRYAFSDGETKTGRIVYRDQGIARFIASVCFAIGDEGKQWLEASNEKYDSIEELVEDFNAYIKSTGISTRYFNVTIAGREYIKDNFTRYELFFPKVATGQVFIERTDVTDKRLVQYDPTLHLIRAQVTDVASFNGDSTATDSVAADFSMEEDTSDAAVTEVEDDMPF